ncbi:unnamed protein product [Brassica rapa]|uniref:Uncharacterized protein n=1 Tax=Brassica campestris TaxID=3711 RepID=A0A8D9GY80_BRACM|nr:unnamed protein product [Brassica rapa]
MLFNITPLRTDLLLNAPYSSARRFLYFYKRHHNFYHSLLKGQGNLANDTEKLISSSQQEDYEQPYFDSADWAL